MKERLRRFMKAENLNSTSLAQNLNIQASGISHILSGRNKPSYDFVTKLLTNFPNLNPDWLLLGKGPMHRDEIRTKTPKNASESTALFSEESQSMPELSSLLFPTDDSDSSVTNTSLSENSETIAEIVSNTPAQFSASQNMAIRCSNIERVMIFYTDGSFDTYAPSQKK